jgi:hypothetical protein
MANYPEDTRDLTSLHALALRWSCFEMYNRRVLEKQAHPILNHGINIVLTSIASSNTNAFTRLMRQRIGFRHLPKGQLELSSVHPQDTTSNGILRAKIRKLNRPGPSGYIYSTYLTH